MGVQVAEVEITGTSALLMHAFPLCPVEGIEKKPIAEQAEYGAYRDPDTRGLYLPGVAVQRGLVAAAAFSKGKGRASLQKVAAACLLVSPERIPLGTETYTVDSRPVVIPATKGRVMRHRPRLDTWRATFYLEWDATLMSQEQVRRVVDDMGTRVGLLEFRPERKGPFGRCVVTSWTVVGKD